MQLGTGRNKVSCKVGIQVSHSTCASNHTTGLTGRVHTNYDVLCDVSQLWLQLHSWLPQLVDPQQRQTQAYALEGMQCADVANCARGEN